MDREVTRRWGLGIPSSEELAPLSTRLITPVLACAFNIDGDSGAALTEEEVEEAALNTVRGGMERATPSQVSPQEDSQMGPPPVGLADGGWDGRDADGAEGYPGEEPTGGVAIMQGRDKKVRMHFSTYFIGRIHCNLSFSRIQIG